MIYNPNTARREAFRLARQAADEAETRVLMYLMERFMERALQDDVDRADAHFHQFEGDTL